MPESMDFDAVYAGRFRKFFNAREAYACWWVCRCSLTHSHSNCGKRNSLFIKLRHFCTFIEVP